MPKTIATRVVATLALGFLWSCASMTPGAHPHDMSAAQHDATAREEQRKADAQTARYDPNAKVSAQSCTDLFGSPACWTSTTNPTKDHFDRAEEHRRRAAEHRAASQALRDAESRACVGLSPRDRDQSPFDHKEDIASVVPLYGPEPGTPAGAGYESGPARADRLQGAVVTFRALPSMTAQWLQRIVDCHLARNAALGNEVPEMPYCPLVPKNVSARVNAAPSGFAISVHADDPETGREVLRRAQALVAH